MRIQFARIAMGGILLQSLMWFALGKFFHQRYEQFAAEGKRQYDKDLVESIFPYVKWSLNAMILLRVILLAGSFKYPAWTKLFFFHHMVFYCLANTLPLDYGGV